MRIQDLIQEVSEVDKGLIRSFKDKGYQRLGSGIDSVAFLKPGTRHVLKIFGTDCAGTSMSPDQQMFMTWAKFCQANQSNPHLPRIHDISTFIWPHGDRPCVYLQARMERLKDITLVWKGFLMPMSRAVMAGQSYEQWAEAQKKKPGAWQFFKKNPRYVDQYPGLYSTMQEVFAMGERLGYDWDLHSSNIMRRDGDVFVVADPWHLHQKIDEVPEMTS